MIFQFISVIGIELRITTLHRKRSVRLWQKAFFLIHFAVTFHKMQYMFPMDSNVDYNK